MNLVMFLLLMLALKATKSWDVLNFPRTVKGLCL